VDRHLATESQLSGEVKIENNEAVIEAPPEEMKAFAAGLRVGYKRGFLAGYTQRITEEDATLGIEPSEVLFNKPS
jgi:hypothetical protein